MKYVCSLIIFILLITTCDAKPSSSQPLTVPLWTLMLDTKDSGKLPRRFRTTYDSMPQGFELAGLDSLNISGSAQFSIEQFANIVDYLNGLGFPPAQVVVIDLRAEPHAFMNGLPINWSAQGAWWLQSDPVVLILANEKKRLESLSVGQNVLVKSVDQKDDAGYIKTVSSLVYKITSLNTEEQVVQKAGAHYFRLPISDHMRPEDKDVDQFLLFVKNLPAHVWLHFHCHGGHGRTSTFMIMYDMMRNSHLSFDAIIDRQVQLGSLDLRHLSGSKKAYKRPEEELRYQFIRQFYEFLHASDGYGVLSWTNWIMNRRVNQEKRETNYEGDNTFGSSTISSPARVRSS
ncbi:MAG: hypothetical protein FJX71_04540 [Alphaproteobacteria bacterium]|nr:hypothetical protein [Alphaproteobacteria bacterium]